MSRTNNNNNTSNSPVSKYLKFSGKSGTFSFWNGESNTDVAPNLKFSLLETKSKIVGWDESSQSRIYSNEVGRLDLEELTVRTSKGSGNIAKGLYSDIKGDLATSDAKFATVIYAGTTDGEILHVTLTASALGAWMDFKNSNKSEIWTHYIVFTGFEERKKGAVTYKVPVFAIGEKIDSEGSKVADELSRKVDAYFGVGETLENESLSIPVSTADMGMDDDLPF